MLLIKSDASAGEQNITFKNDRNILKISRETMNKVVQTNAQTELNLFIDRYISKIREEILLSIITIGKEH